MPDCIIIGGGAAGVFAAIESARQGYQTLLLEKTNSLLSKVRISGGGRCNVTHNLYDPKEVALHYPRGSKELIGPLHRFGPKETVEWFAREGIRLKAEKDGRMFPESNTSETIIHCLLDAAKDAGVTIRKVAKIEQILPGFEIHLKGGEILSCHKLILATGSSPKGYEWAQSFGHTIQKPIPSLFTFNVPTSPLKELSGISVQNALLTICGHSQIGPLLLTHFGFSGPCAIKLSAWAAKELAASGYRETLLIDWLPHLSTEEVFEALKGPTPLLSKKLWKHFTKDLGRTPSHKELRSLAEKLKRDPYAVEGKTTNKEEFVTCGGITLSEIDFKTMESKLCKDLHFVGEILDIDGVTGGFNFQSAWVTGWISAQRNSR